MADKIHDFSEESIENIESIVNEIEDDGQLGFFDWIGDWSISIPEIDQSRSNLNEYHKAVIDKHDVGRTEFENIQMNVKTVDEYYERKLIDTKDEVINFNTKLHEIALLITPSVISVDSESFQKFTANINLIFSSKTNKEVFDENGDFGADQGGPKATWNSLRYTSSEEKEFFRQMIINRIGRYMTDEEITEFVENLAYEGCGYASAVNVILNKFKGREDEFEEKFGISYYDEQGNVNFDEILIDFYHNENDLRDLPGTSNEFYFPHPGVLAGDLQSNINKYCEDHGVSISSSVESIYSEDEIRERLKNGETVLMTCYFDKMTLIRKDGSEYGDVGWHTVTIVGFDESKGQFIISSWGTYYYLDNLPGLADIIGYK